jgi:hypothetical protein
MWGKQDGHPYDLWLEKGAHDVVKASASLGHI